MPRGACSSTVERRNRNAKAEGSIPSKSIMDSKRLGALGEKIAEGYLKGKGYQILDKNYSFRFVSGQQKGEIDIIVKKDKVISFVEVKSLRVYSGAINFFAPEDKINFNKQRKLIKTAEIWLAKKKIPLDSKWQIDVISIKIDFFSKKAKIQHFENAIGG